MIGETWHDANVVRRSATWYSVSIAKNNHIIDRWGYSRRVGRFPSAGEYKTTEVLDWSEKCGDRAGNVEENRGANRKARQAVMTLAYFAGPGPSVLPTKL